MAVGDTYATAAQYKAVFKKTDGADDTVIADDLAAISRFLEHKLGRHFTQDTSAVARTFYPAPERGWPAGAAEAENPWKGLAWSRHLFVDDIAAAPTSIKVDENRDGAFERILAATDYQLMPLNADKGAEARPWTALYLPSWSTLLGWPPGAMVEVTAKWGWPAAVPKAIQQACIHLTGILRLESPRATLRVPEGIDQAISTSQTGQRILEDLVKHYKKVDL